jgi:futalosine hydrolase
MDTGEYPFTNGLLKATETNMITGFRKVRGITVNKSHGRSESISEIKAKFPAQVESMEGAAVFYVCNWLGVDCLQIRAISNYVEPRETAFWNIPLALEKLSESVLGILRKLPVAVV